MAKSPCSPLGKVIKTYEPSLGDPILFMNDDGTIHRSTDTSSDRGCKAHIIVAASSGPLAFAAGVDVFDFLPPFDDGGGVFTPFMPVNDFQCQSTESQSLFLA